MELAQKMKITRFKASEGWLTNFKLRHGSLFRKTTGGSLSSEPIEESNELSSGNSTDLLQQLLSGGFFQNNEDEEEPELIDDSNEFETNVKLECNGVDKETVDGKILLTNHFNSLSTPSTYLFRSIDSVRRNQIIKFNKAKGFSSRSLFRIQCDASVY